MSNDTTLSQFPELAGRHVIVFDGTCVLCSRFFRFVLARDRRRRYHFVIAQSALGEALYRHFGLKSADYETNLVLVDGVLIARLEAFARVMADIGGPWRALAAVRLLPRPLGDWLYERIARNRYRIFGRTEQCLVPSPEVRARFLDSAPSGSAHG